MDYTELLPPLPEPANDNRKFGRAGFHEHIGPAYTADQLRAAQLAAIAAAAPAIRRAERERCARVCESLVDLDDDSCNEAERCASAIRALPEEP